MPEKSLFQIDNIPETDILTYFFPRGTTPSNQPIWTDADQPNKKSLSPRQMLHWVKRLGIGLGRFGLQQNDVVLVLSTNHIFYPVAYFGAAGHGYILSGCNPAYGVDEVKYQDQNTGAAILLVDPIFLPTALQAAQKAGLSRDRIFLFSDEPCAPVDDVRDWRSLLDSSQEAEKWRWQSFSPAESKTKVAGLNYSSGTTGLPKGVMISHYNIIANVEQSLYMRRLKSTSPESLQSSAFGDREERWLSFLPLYHAYGQLHSIGGVLKTLARTYFMRSFDYRKWLSHVQEYNITHVQTVPPILVMLDKRPETKEYNIDSLKNVLCGAAPFGKELQSSVMSSVGWDLVVSQAYGMTELTCCAFHVPGLMSDLSGSIGLLDPNLECCLIDDNGNEVGEGVPGEACIRGPNRCLGYWRNQKATRDTIDREGYLKTGDVMIRRQNWYWVVDRKKELIKVRGFQVAPAELEAVLIEHNDIADAAVVALKVNHEEFPRAYVTLKDHAKGIVTEEDIVRWTATKVARHKYLSGGVIFVDEVPKSPSGKIQRKTIRDWAARAVESGARARL